MCERVRMPRRKTPLEPMRIEQFDCETRFLVGSESRPDEVHLVDLCGERGAECSCEDWEFRNKDWVLGNYRYRCKHILEVQRRTEGFA